MTKFIVLTKADGGCWTETGHEDAYSAQQAAKTAYLKNPKNVVAIVAVPERSWRPTPIRVEQVTKVVLGDEPKAAE